MGNPSGDTHTLIVMVRSFFVLSLLVIFSAVYAQNEKILLQTLLKSLRNLKSTRSDSGVSRRDKNKILDLHNQYRSNVTPTAKNMMKMAWNEEIATYAQKYAEDCIAGHDASSERAEGTGLGISIGQNLARGFTPGAGAWQKVVDAWHNEVNLFTYGSSSNDFHAVGHYTQMVYAQSSHIGCGYHECEWGTNFVCNYAYLQYDPVNHPYTEGPSCSSCPGHCVDNMCTCGNKLDKQICYNGGTLNLGTCECECQGIFTPESQCKEVNCPESDEWYCGSGNFVESNCDVYANIPEVCPFMCGLC